VTAVAVEVAAAAWLSVEDAAVAGLKGDYLNLYDPVQHSVCSSCSAMAKRSKPLAVLLKPWRIDPDLAWWSGLKRTCSR